VSPERGYARPNSETNVQPTPITVLVTVLQYFTKKVMGVEFYLVCSVRREFPEKIFDLNMKGHPIKFSSEKKNFFKQSRYLEILVNLKTSR
jgi:hypothetical protein